VVLCVAGAGLSLSEQVRITRTDVNIVRLDRVELSNIYIAYLAVIESFSRPPDLDGARRFLTKNGWPSGRECNDIFVVVHIRSNFHVLYYL
jgi:hypothetical protein